MSGPMPSTNSPTLRTRPEAATTAITTEWDARLGLSYLSAGAQGPAVALLHGWGAFKELWWSTLRALAPEYRAFAPDMPGHGASPLRDIDTMAGLADLIADFCAARDLNAITLVGHSMGGNIALELALRRPDLVQRLALVDAALEPRQMPLYVRPYATSLPGWSLLRLSLAFARHFRPLGRRVPPLHGGGWIIPWLRRSTYATFNEPIGMHRLIRNLFANPIGARLGAIRVPTLVITGQFDGLVPPELSRRAARAIPGARFAVIPGALHNPMDERPRAFERTLLAFLHEIDQ